MVEWKKLGEVMKIVRGASPRPITNYITSDSDGINWIKIGDVEPGAKYITQCNEKVTKEGAKKSRYLHSGDFILSNSMSFGRPYILKIDGCIHDGWIAMSEFEEHLSSGYLYEILNSNGVQRYWRMKANNGGAMTNLNSDIVKDTIIPIPSLEEQTRIVGILDTFTASIDNLKEQIAQRRKQYEYYRDQLLDFEGKEGVEMKKVDDICEVKGRIGFRGYTREDQVEKENGALVLTATNISNQRIDYSNNTYITWEKYYESPEIMVTNGDILVCQRGSIGKIAIVDNLIEKATINPQLLLLKNIKIDNRYLTYYFLSCFFQSKLSQIIGYGTIQMISQKDFKNLTIPVPCLQEQRRIVTILDTFESSIQNLEAQLSQREKQYEYYRNKLLTFE